MNHHPHSSSVRTEILHLNLKKKKIGWILFLSFITMLVEIAVGYFSNSMALLSYAWHIALHIIVIGVGWLTYQYVVYRHKKERPINTVKTLSFVGLLSAAVIVLAGLFLFAECLRRLDNLTTIKFEEGMWGAGIGLVLNIISLRILHHDKAHTDHTIRATYLHLAADVVTSVLAFLALGIGLYLQWPQADAIAGMVGALIILFWAKGIIIPAWKEIFKKE